MKGKGALIFIGIIAILFMWGCGSYNGLVQKDVAVKKSWANVESQYQRRLDLIDNLVATVKGAANFEQQTLQQLTESRARVGSVQLTPELLKDEAALKKFYENQANMMGALSKLIAVSEAYPDLKATQNFRDLQFELAGTENRIQEARKSYNGAVETYEVATRSFPGNIFASVFGFKPKDMFKSDPGANKVPKIDANSFK